MYTEQIDVDIQKINQRREYANKIFFNSKFNFLNQHNGIRPNNFHLLVAPTHVGKSTLTNSIIHSLCEDNKNIKILLILTEESKEDFETALSIFLNDFSSINRSVRIMVEDKSISSDEMMINYQDAIELHEPDITFIDNLTTSTLYSGKDPSYQDQVASWLKSLLDKTTLFVIAHTNGGDYNTTMLDENHIRGSKTITNLVEFLYIMQPVRINDSLYQYLRVIKHRRQTMKNSFFFLDYQANARTIVGDIPIEFEKFKESFKLRNKL